MNTPRVPIAFLTSSIVLAALLAGCFGGGGSDDDAPFSAPAVPTHGASTGAIEGLVVDEDNMPLEGVQVGIPSLEVTTLTEPDGRFVLNDLEPGAHNLYAQRLGYSPYAQNTRVEAGDVTHVEIRLEAVASTDPRHVTTELVGFMSCGGGLIGFRFTSDCTQDPNHQTSFAFEVEPDLETAIGEVVWRASASMAAQELQLVLWQNPNCSPCDPDYAYGDAAGPSPVVVRADRFAGLNEDEETTIHWFVWTPFEASDGLPIIVVNQRFDLYSTVFYGDPAPEGFLAAPDD